MKPIKLQFEKVYSPFMLIAKKRYAGLYFSTKASIPDKVENKGLETVRRDNCVLIREILKKVLQMLLYKDEKESKMEIAQYVQKQISELVQNKIDISKLVISKGITKKVAGESDQEEGDGKKSKASQNTYKVKQAHV